VEGSDILPQLIHEHQVGFVNRALQAGYVARMHLHRGGELSAEQQGEINHFVGELTRYILFADEAPLPEGGIKGDAKFQDDFVRNRKVSKSGASLRDFDLKRRIFKYPCSYMIYTPLFAELPKVVKGGVMRELKKGLSEGDKSYAHISTEEKRVIREILAETMGMRFGQD
jgi:hypothetical protein